MFMQVSAAAHIPLSSYQFPPQEEWNSEILFLLHTSCEFGDFISHAGERMSLTIFLS